MDTKDNIYVNTADICLSMEYLPPSADHVEIHVEVDHPVRMINLDEYTKKVQDDMMEALRVVDLIEDNNARKTILGESSSIMLTIRSSSGHSGHEFMERYEKWKSDEENKLLREQIEAAKKLLREHGFEVVTV